MGDLTLHELDEATFSRLSQLATVDRVSPEEKAASLLKSALDEQDRRLRRLETADRIASMTPKGIAQTDSTLLIREDRDR